jgi:hypothetical protein
VSGPRADVFPLGLVMLCGLHRRPLSIIRLGHRCVERTAATTVCMRFVDIDLWAPVTNTFGTILMLWKLHFFPMWFFAALTVEDRRTVTSSS